MQWINSLRKAMLNNCVFGTYRVPATKIFFPFGNTRVCLATRVVRSGVSCEIMVFFVFPDTNAHYLGEKPQHVYSVRFTARELWGDKAAPQDSIYLDMWDDYLEPV